MKVFIVEDDLWYGQMLKHHLSMDPELEVELIASGKELMSRLGEKPDVITLDYRLPDALGTDLLKRVKARDSEVPIIVVSGQDDVSTALELLKEGAYDYLMKDDDTQARLWHLVHRAIEEQSMRKELKVLRKQVQGAYRFDKVLIGQSAAMQRVFSVLEKATETKITVSITGETGTGKEVAAKAIHHNSDRAKGPFVAINMSAIPAELLESELFGHEKGAFTGANIKRIGKFEEANKGTIFLDEIGDLALHLQAKLLRVLQEREITALGANKVTKIDCRIIVATHKDLAEEVTAGRFREDLYYRLLGLPIEMPPLRDRDKDSLLLAKHFIDQFCKDNGMPAKALSASAQEKLIDYPFPGNIRELKAIVELAAVMSRTDDIEASDISFRSPGPLNQMLAGDMTLREYNCRIISHFLEKYNGDVQQVAAKLDIGKSTIYNMKKSGEIK